MYTFENDLLDAIETVSAWDLPDEDFTDAVNAQARFMSGITSDEYWAIESNTPIQ